MATPRAETLRTPRQDGLRQSISTSLLSRAIEEVIKEHIANPGTARAHLFRLPEGDAEVNVPLGAMDFTIKREQVVEAGEGAMIKHGLHKGTGVSIPGSDLTVRVTRFPSNYDGIMFEREVIERPDQSAGTTWYIVRE